MSNRSFNTGDAVVTPFGKGTIAWRRMAGPDYSKVQSYSVLLDKHKNKIGYSGSIVQADQVSPDYPVFHCE